MSSYVSVRFILLFFQACLFLPNLHATTNIPLATHFRAFGPLPYSKERATDPLHSVRTPLLTTLLSLTTFPSESAVGGYASWRDCPVNATAPDVIKCPFPDADSALPYEAWAVANFSVHSDAGHSHILQCSDPAVVKPLDLRAEYEHLIADDPRHGVTDCPSDVYGDGRSLCALRLYPGSYRVFIRTTSDRNHTAFQCNYYRDPAENDINPLLPIDDSVTPDIILTRSPPAAHLAGKHLSVTIQNTHTTQWATAGTARLLHAPEGLRLAPHATSDDHFPLPRIAPRQIRQLRIDLLTDPNFLHPDNLPTSPESVSVSVAVSYDMVSGTKFEAVFNVTLAVAIWRETRSYHFTYVDVDGSVQAAAVLPPKMPCVGAPAGGDACPVLLSTHGAGVNAVARAWTESYKTQNQSWVLLPTGRRKYGLNWEGPQMKSAITAVKVLAERLPGVPPLEKDEWKARSDMWLQAGHSMGGHGALLLATHYPDMLVAALPAMGWLRLSTYAGLGYSEQLSYSDAASRALLTIASAEYSADLYAENLLGIPFLARVGSDDQSVPPSQLRKFCRLLKENEYFSNFTSSYVTLNEVSGEGHWFDGVVDDQPLQTFIDNHLSAKAKPPLPNAFSVFTMNPATSGSRGGLRILSLEVVFQISRLRVVRDAPEPGTWTIDTENVRRFRYQPVSGIIDQPEHLLIDGAMEKLRVPRAAFGKGSEFVDFCVAGATAWSPGSRPDTRPVFWKLCRDVSSWGTEQSTERGPDNSGPSFQVLAERKLVIVYPEGDIELQDSAVSYANSLYLRGISAQVTTDSDVSVGQLSPADKYNVVLLGGPNMNRMARKYYLDGFSADVTFEGKGFCIAGKRCFEKPGTGIAFLSSGWKRRLLFYVAGTDRDGMIAALSFLPRSPASNAPEWVVVSKERGYGFRGLGGVAALGYWDYNWKLEPRKSYPAEFIFDDKQSGLTCAVARTNAPMITWTGVLVIFTCLIISMGLWRMAHRLRNSEPRYQPVAKAEPQETVDADALSLPSREKETLLVQDEGTGLA